ncbi:sensor histidine kinase [Streptomyces albidoflavus]|uniref:sensor histidine kinase n=1 Tax=Streptomyces albidoflavus TaxID=1886 RepID=UPI00101E821E|nr:sensor histidine kinase [Streptomyces albidoflavus]RZD80965.1 ATP-binding protein [Streptomyces albidoflavus]RZD98535.1 ATP-binding protein [Streptomyces albidoflavus]
MSESLPAVPVKSPTALPVDPLPARPAPPAAASRPSGELPLAAGRSAPPSYAFGSPYALQVASRITQCPPPPPDLREPSPSHFVYGLTLPSAGAAPLIASETADAVLDVHEVEEELVGPVLELVHELAVHACRFTGAGEMIHLLLRRFDGVLQVVAHDTHTPHLGSRLARQCAERRRVSLTVVRELAEGWGGECGFAAAHPPATGVCTWVSIGAGLTGASGPGGVQEGAA